MKRNLTEAQILAAGRLKAVFRSTKKIHGHTYETLAGELGWTAGAVSQYMNANVGMNMSALTKMCAKIPDANPVTLFPELFEGTELQVIKESTELFEAYETLDPEMRQAIAQMILLNAQPKP